MYKIYFLWKIVLHFLLSCNEQRNRVGRDLLTPRQVNSNSGNHDLIQPMYMSKSSAMGTEQWRTKCHFHHIHINITEFCEMRMLKLALVVSALSQDAQRPSS